MKSYELDTFLIIRKIVTFPREIGLDFFVLVFVASYKISIKKHHLVCTQHY